MTQENAHGRKESERRSRSQSFSCAPGGPSFLGEPQTLRFCVKALQQRNGKILEIFRLFFRQRAFVRAIVAVFLDGVGQIPQRLR